MNKRTKVLKYVKYVDSTMAPVSIQVGITDYCFNKCHMCGHPDRKNKTELDFFDWVSFLGEHSNEIESVCYSGGDPALYTRLNSLMKFHEEIKIEFGLITAGYFKENTDYDLLSKARWVRVSLDAVDPGIYESCRGGISIDKVITSILAAKMNGVNIELNVTVTDRSAPGLQSLFAFALRNRLNVELHPIYGGSLDVMKINPFLNYYSEIFAKEKIPFVIYHYKPVDYQSKCKAVYYQTFIDSYGDIYPCCMIAGDTTDSPKGKPLGSIYDFDDYVKHRYLFSELSPDARPELCKLCPERLALINSVIINEPDINKKSFF